VHNKQSIVIVCGATASGKSDFALSIAQQNNGVIINADSMQIYQEVRILTARPTPIQEAMAEHRLYGFVSVMEPFSVAKWLEYAKVAIDSAFSEGKLPIVTGGTGLYLKSLQEGLSPVPENDPLMREQATRLWQEQGEKALQARDPEMAMQLKPLDKQRHIRALEVLLATGKSLRYFQALPRIKPYPDAAFTLHFINPPRAELYARCNQRFEVMLAEGALEEVKRLKAMNIGEDLPASRILGLRELGSYLDGETSLEEGVAKARQVTRNYAKRQVTWFSHQ